MSHAAPVTSPISNDVIPILSALSLQRCYTSGFIAGLHVIIKKTNDEETVGGIVDETNDVRANRTDDVTRLMRSASAHCTQKRNL